MDLIAGLTGHRRDICTTVATLLHLSPENITVHYAAAIKRGVI